MQITVTRLDGDGRYRTAITRDDGVIYSLQGVAHKFAVPHDVAHFVVEQALGLATGFWGSIADGAVFSTMTYQSGRRKPKAAERSKIVLKANARALVEAEVLVRVFNDTIEQGHGETSPVLARRLQQRHSEQRLSASAIRANIPAVYASYREVQTLWTNTPVDGTLGLRWRTARNGRGRAR